MATSQSPSAFLCVALTSIDDGRSFWEEARYQGGCAGCGRIRVPWEAHHVLFRQECRRAGAPEWSPDNALRTCVDRDACHHAQHSGAPDARRIAVSKLRDENLAFILRHLGAGAGDNYLTRHYEDDGDPRLDVLLEQLAR
jgi:hypothetical protein